MQYIKEILPTSVFSASGSPDSKDADEKSPAQWLENTFNKIISKIGLNNFLSLISPSEETTVAPPIVFPPETSQPELDFAETLKDTEWHSHNGCWRMRMNDRIARRYRKMMAAIGESEIFTLVTDEKGEWIQRDI